MLIGAHVPTARPVAEAESRSADAAQIFASNPRGWKAATPRDDAAELRAAGLPLWVHAPYLINLVSADGEVRRKSRDSLQATLAAAAAIDARGVVVHGGHAGRDGDRDEGVRAWREALDGLDPHGVPVLVENTAGGSNAMARYLDDVALLWEGIADVEGVEVGFCLDTCHLHAAGEPLEGAVERVLAITGRIDLVHANDSHDEAGSGRDHHANLGDGRIDPDLLVAVIREADAPVVVETPGGAEAQAADIAWLRQRLG